MAGLITACAFLLRIYQIGEQELWIDEALSFHRATTAGGLRPDIVGDPSPPLYYLLLRMWIMMAGTGEGALRLPSAIYGTLFVVTVLWTGCEFFNRRVGLWSAAFSAVAPIHIYYSQEARPYALLVLLLLLTTVLLGRAVRIQGRTNWMLVTGSAVAALYTHYFAALGLLSIASLAMVGEHGVRFRPRIVQLGKVAIVCVVLFLPWVWWSFFLTPHSAGETDWIRLLWNNTPPSLAIPKSMELFALGGHAGFFPPLAKTFPYLTFSESLRMVDLVLVGILGLWVAGPWMDGRLHIPHVRALKRCFLLMLIFPLAALWIVSLFKPVYVVGRYDLVAFPAFILLMGLAMTKVQQVTTMGTLLALVIALGLMVPTGAKLAAYYAVPPSPPLGAYSARDTAVAIAAAAGEGDVVLFTGLRGMPVLYALHNLGLTWNGRTCQDSSSARRFACRLFPREVEQAPATYNAARVLLSPSAARPEAIRDDLQDFLSDLAAPHGKIWLVRYVLGYQNGEFLLWPQDKALEGELEAMGYQRLTSEAGQAMGILQFDREGP
jgi:4-amino-4-deoxy-L-arabinose transferase-like glycosyltransferase